MADELTDQHGKPWMETVQVVIASGATGLSAAVNLKGRTPVAIQMPADWVDADLTFQASLDGGTTYYNLYDEDGTEVTVKADDDRVIALSTLANFWHGGWIKIRSGTSGTPVDQTSSRTLILATRLG